jgi:hypothetical protein
MLRQRYLLCLFVSFSMSLAIPIISEEIFVSAHKISERPSHSAMQEALKDGASEEVALANSYRRVEGLERITYRFSDWYSFREYLSRVAHYFVILLVATFIVSGVSRNGSEPT